MTSDADGFSEGDSLYYRVWDQSTGATYDGASIQVQYNDAETYYDADGAFGGGVYAVLSSLEAGNTTPALAAPTPLSPSDEATGVSTEPPLTWSSVPEAAGYDVTVSSTSDFSSIVASASGLSDTTFVASGLSYETTYYWRVRALSDGSSSYTTSPYSSASQFTTRIELVAPQLLQPGDESTGVPADPMLAWGSARGADTYRLQVAAGSDFSSPLIDSTLSDTTSALQGLATETAYAWRMQSLDASGASSAFSAAYTFTTEAPDSGLLVTPDDDATGVNPQVVFDWVAVEGARRYTLEVATDSGFEQVAFKQNNVSDTQYGPVSLGANTTYYWRIEGRGRRGFKKQSEVHRFTTSPSSSLKQAGNTQELPDEIVLNGNYPNPVHRQTTISFALPEQATVSLTVYDMLGRAVIRLANGPLAAGYYQYQWIPEGLASGQYIYRLRVNDQSFTKTLVLVR